MTFIEINEPTTEALEAFRHLIPQLAPDVPSMTQAALEALVTSEDAILIFAVAEDQTIVGTLTLMRYRIPTGLKFWVEDVVVDQAHRGKGIGKGLLQYAMAKATQLGATKIDLTSSPDKVAANNLYQSLGFLARQTNVYRYSI